MSAEDVLPIALTVSVLAPAALVVVLAVSSRMPRERGKAPPAAATWLLLCLSFVAAGAALAIHLGLGRGARVFSLGDWFTLGEGAFAFDFRADSLSMGFAVLATGVCAVVAVFSARYLHRDPGFHRYFVQLAFFALGILLVALAGSVEVLYVGWELIGLSSALLVGFFHERRAPVRNALRVFAVYRTSDAALLGAAVLLHHWSGTGSLSLVFAGETPIHLASGHAFVIASLLIVAVAGKCALLPFSGWLPRAMEGPTPSSAVYYGALSIHAGCLLLLRIEPILAQSLAARALAALLGVVTALYATFVARVQTDVKSALAYASLTQVGIIVLEISLGLTTLAVAHVVGHVCFRLLQFLSAPNILHDLHELENRLPGEIAVSNGALRSGWYLAALERGYVDPLIERWIQEPLTRLLRFLDRLDRLLASRGRDR